jgi:hypothetical protein
VDADANGGQRAVIGVRLLEAQRKAQGRAGGPEHEQEAVAGAVDDATVPLARVGDKVPHVAAVSLDQRDGGSVAEPLLEPGRVLQVRENEGHRPQLAPTCGGIGLTVKRRGFRQIGHERPTARGLRGEYPLYRPPPRIARRIDRLRVRAARTAMPHRRGARVMATGPTVHPGCSGDRYSIDW